MFGYSGWDLICYAGAVHFEFRQIRSRNELPTQSVRQLVDSWFVIIRGPYSGERLIEVAAAYDKMMALASGPNVKIASTTTRMSDVSRSS
jgi:hypothetical protein